MPTVSWSSKARRVWPWLAAICSGLLCAACFPPFNQSWFSWFALVPLIAAVWFSGENSRRRWLRNLLLGYLAGIVFFYGDLQLARRAWRFVPKLFSARAVIIVVDLSRAPFRFLELADRIHKTKGVHRVMAQLARRICGRVRVGDSRMDAWLALQRFWLERSRRCPPRRVANDSSR